MGNSTSNLGTFVDYKLPELPYSAITLSRYGYTYNKATGLIQCSNCSFDITNSTSDMEILLAKHRKWSPNCPFLDCKEFESNSHYKSSIELLQNLQGTKISLTQSERSEGKGQGLNCKMSLPDQEEDQVDSCYESATSNLSAISSISANNHLQNNISSLRYKSNMGLQNVHGTRVNSPTLMKTLCMISLLLKRSHDETFTEVNNGKTEENNIARNKNAEAIEKQNQESFEVTLLKYSKHPIMSCTEERRESFKGQEQKYKHCERANIEDFVTAGLFYVGPEDNVRCFFCDGGLRNVQSHNDPFLEHKRWFPNCKFVLYLEEQRKQTPQLQKDNAGQVLGITAVPPLKIPGRALEAREVKARLETPVVQELMRQGFQREYLKRAIERRFILHGDDFKSAEELIRDILDVEGEKALPRLSTTSKQGAEDAVDSSQPTSAAAANSASSTSSAVVPAVRSATGQKLLGKGKDLLAAEADLPVSEALRNMKITDLLTTLKATTMKNPELKRLWGEYQELSQVRTCKICLDREINTVFLPCGHYVTCDKCCPKISHCCICRALIRGTVLALSATSEIK